MIEMKKIKYGSFTGMVYKVPLSKWDIAFNGFFFITMVIANIAIWYVVYQQIMKVL